MTVSAERVEILERANYCAMRPTAEVTPGLDITIRDDVVITRSALFPTPDTNHACLLRTAPKRAEALLDEIVEELAPQGVPTTIALSPACAPDDWADRLQHRGFIAQPGREAWMVLEDVTAVVTPESFAGVTVHRIGREEAGPFARVFLEAFEMPGEFAPYMTQLLEPSIGLPSTFHYLAFVDGEPVGTFTLLQYGEYGIIGSAGVVKSHRRSGAATNLMIHGVREAQQLGVHTLIQQTASGAVLERLLRITGFRTVFTRSYYSLE